MSTPFKRDNSSVPYFRKAVPKDLQAVVGRAVIKQSLRTKDPVQAALRHAELEATWERNFASLRAGVVTLTHRERVALAGVLYREYLDAYRDEPGEAWTVTSRILNDAVAAGSPGVKVLVGGKPEITSHLLARLKDRHRKILTDFLAREGLSLTVAEFDTVLGHVNRVMYDGSKRILSFHLGDC